jgi:hypothetical protein
MTNTATPQKKLEKTGKENKKPLGGSGTPHKTPETTHFLKTIENLLAYQRESIHNHRPIYTKNKPRSRRTETNK